MNEQPETAPRVVVIGGGTGSYTVLRGLRDYQLHLSAVVSVMDSGGSSGRLRDEFGQLPPGDLRRCLLALSPDDEAGMVLRRLMEYRFDRGTGLNGHSFGNLLIAALTEIAGSMEEGIAAATKILNVRGHVIPVTFDDVHLCARLRDGTLIRGETNIDVRTVKPEVPIEAVMLDAAARPNPAALEAIAGADLVVLGPGDLYTSLVPNLLVPGVAEVVAASPALKVYVCNLMTKHGETDGFTASNFAREVCRYLRIPKLDVVIVQRNGFSTEIKARYAAERAFPVEVDRENLARCAARIVEGDFAPHPTLARHDSALLAAELIQLCHAHVPPFGERRHRLNAKKSRVPAVA